MQTFLTSKNFSDIAQTLDSRRLNKQILETYQILKVLSTKDPKAGWRNHPAVRMWRGSEHVLFNYAKAMVKEAKSRGIRTEKNEENLKVLRESYKEDWGSQFPEWLQNPEFSDRIITTHRANLYKKDPEYYHSFRVATVSKNNKPCCSTCSYFWVTHVNKEPLIA